MSYLLKIINPRIGVLTNISFEHSEYFDVLVSETDQKKREEKILNLTTDQELLLLKSLPRNGIAILNIDNENIRKSKNEIKSKKITVSAKNNKVDFFVKEIRVDLSTFRAEFVHKNRTHKISISRPLPLHYASSILLAVATCFSLKIPVDFSIRVLENNFYLPPGRFSIFEGIKNSTIIDSSYNNPTLYPILDILDFLKKVGGKRRKVAIIGDMRELGTVAQSQHEALANKILSTTDVAVLIGLLMKKYVAPILEKNNHNFFSFKTFTQSRNIIKRLVRNKDIILVKGSQNTLFLERVVEMLLKDKRDKEKLARRGEFWDEKRKETP